jgi:hypothetical protein
VRESGEGSVLMGGDRDSTPIVVGERSIFGEDMIGGDDKGWVELAVWDDEHGRGGWADSAGNRGGKTENTFEIEERG